MGFYDRISKTALKVIKKYGQVVTITRRTQGAYNPATSTAPVTETTETGRGVVYDYKDAEVDGTMVQRGDSKLLLSSIGITKPTVNDVATLANGDKFTILDVDVVSPAGTDVVYICQIRR